MSKKQNKDTDNLEDIDAVSIEIVRQYMEGFF